MQKLMSIADANDLLAGAPRQLARKSLGAEVYEALRRMIIRRQIEPGAKITENSIAALLGVSRTPVREAFMRLDLEGWLIDRPGRSCQVAPITFDKIEEIYPLIATLEGLAIRLACARLTENDLRYMDALTAEMALHARRGATEELLEADNRFHGVIHERAENGRLRSVITHLRAQMERLEYVFFSTPTEVRASLKRHRKLVRVLRTRKPRTAQKALERQWEMGQQALLKIVAQKHLVTPESEPANAQALKRIRQLASDAASTHGLLLDGR